MAYQYLRQILTDRNISAREVAHLAGIASQDLYNALNGRKPFYPSWRKRIAAALGLPEDVLFPPEDTEGGAK